MECGDGALERAAGRVVKRDGDTWSRIDALVPPWRRFTHRSVEDPRRAGARHARTGNESTDPRERRPADRGCPPIPPRCHPSDRPVSPSAVAVCQRSVNGGERRAGVKPPAAGGVRVKAGAHASTYLLARAGSLTVRPSWRSAPAPASSKPPLASTPSTAFVAPPRDASPTRRASTR